MLGIAAPHWTRKLHCRLRGHTGIIVPAWIGRFPGNHWVFENARCSRCGELRWPINGAPR